MHTAPNPTSTESLDGAIALLAYSFFEKDGRRDGHDLEHWLCAEGQLVPNRQLKTESGKIRTSSHADPQANPSVRPIGGRSRKTGGSRGAAA